MSQALLKENKLISLCANQVFVSKTFGDFVKMILTRVSSN